MKSCFSPSRSELPPFFLPPQTFNVHGTAHLSAAVAASNCKDYGDHRFKSATTVTENPRTLYSTTTPNDFAFGRQNAHVCIKPPVPTRSYPTSLFVFEFTRGLLRQRTGRLNMTTGSETAIAQSFTANSEVTDHSIGGSRRSENTKQGSKVSESFGSRRPPEKGKFEKKADL